MLMMALILIFAFLLNLFLPWWSIVIPGLAFGYWFHKKPMVSLGWGFLSVFILWGGQALYIHLMNEGILTTRIADMLGVGNPVIVILATGLIGGLVSGLATLAGAFANPNERAFDR